MRSLFRNLVPVLFASVLAAPLLTTGCQSQAPSQDDSYIQWEHETHREHIDVDKRSADERKQYDDWHHSHQDHH
jgi:outer membrane PBP1 activator LpoA protein